MCPPTEYTVSWEINPWMKIGSQPNHRTSWQQWHRLFEVYQKLGLRVFLMPQVRSLPDMVFTANSAWGRKGQFILSNFRHKERQPEQEHFKQWFECQKYKVLQLPPNITFEGQGDFITLKEAYFLGYGQRSDLAAKDFIKDRLKLQKEIVPLKLVDERFYHLDTCLMYLYPIDTIMYFPGAFDQESREKIKNCEADKIEVTLEEAESFICNGVYFEESVVLGGKTERIAPILQEKGLNVINLNLSEFKKSGAGARCLTLFLD